MKYFLLLPLIFASFNTWSDSPNLSRRFGISLAAGKNKPFTGNDFDDRADGEFVFGLYGRYQFNQESGIQLGYTRYEWTHSPTAARIYDLVYLHRLKARKWFTPIWGVGAGLVDIANYNVDENLKLGLKARVGVEFMLSSNMIVDAVIDYQFVNKMVGEDDNLTIGEIHALAPQLILTYFFGSGE
ncbi:MAG: outer membrane beta-barrel protein [Bdellovibrionales bacterium]|nr:outer membrane beta-barrel protein [Bdellovibrionales bacterium]